MRPLLVMRGGAQMNDCTPAQLLVRGGLWEDRQLCPAGKECEQVTCLPLHIVLDESAGLS